MPETEQKTGDVVQLPLDQSEGAKLGRKLWRKQILPIGRSIQYQGETLDFTTELADQLINSFDAGAFETVPLVLADEENRHGENPERQRGQVVALERTDDGLNALIETDTRGSEIMQNNPKMGVSPRLFTEYVRGNDGKEFGTVLRHVALTLDPQVYGLKEWESVDLSADHGENVINLSASEYTTKGGEMSKETEVVETPAAETETPAAEDTAGDEGRGETVDLTAVNGKLTEAIDLANRAIAEKNELADKLHAQETEARLEKLQTGEFAVPKSVIDLARPLVMRRESQVIDLTAADGTKSKSDVSSEVFKMLEAMKVIPLSEDGRVDLTANPATDADAALESLREQFGTS